MFRVSKKNNGLSICAAGIFSFFSSIIPVSSFRIDFTGGPRAQVETQDIGDATSEKKPLEGKRTGGIVGDPSHRRGFDLGYDAGPRAGIEDKAQNKTASYSQRPEYMDPEQFYRYEYGSRAMFVAGYRRGFSRGYSNSFASEFRKGLPERIKNSGPRLKKNAFAHESKIAGDAW